MVCNDAINNLTCTCNSGETVTAYNGSYWKDANISISAKDLDNNLVYTGDVGCIKSNWDYGFTLSEDYIKEIVEKITKNGELAKITPDEGPEIPKWLGFLPI